MKMWYDMIFDVIIWGFGLAVTIWKFSGSVLVSLGGSS